VSAVVLVPWCSSFHGGGMEEGPAAVAGALGAHGAATVEMDMAAPPEDALAAGLPRVHAAVADAGRNPVVLLGECTLAPAVTAGLRAAHPGLVLVWVDAHGDLNTPETSPSGFLGGMPFAVLLGWCHDRLRAAAGLDPALPEDRAALVGARDLDPGERAAIERSRLVTADDVATALSMLPDGSPIHLHLDGDVLDPADAPGVDFPAPDGWSGTRLDAEMTALAATGRVVGVSLCCGNPRRDPDGRGARAYVRALQPFMGE
jgi:arginase